MKLGVVLLDARTPYSLKVLLRPVQLKASGNGIHQAFVALKNFQGTGYPAHSKEGSMSSAESCVRISQPFPVGEAARACDAQGIVGCAAYRDRVGDTMLIKTQRPGHTSRYRVGSLSGVIEAFRTYRSYIR